MPVCVELDKPNRGLSQRGQRTQFGISVSPASESVVLEVTAEWHVARAQNTVRAVLEDRCFSSVCSAYIVTAVSELATNLVFHATHGGRITLACRPHGDGHEVVVVSEDDGPGISDLEQALLDGFSTNGGLGGGLPGVERLMDEFEIESKAGSGTRIRCRKWNPCK